MTSATEHFQAGRLAEALAAALAEVKAAPGVTAKRVFLAELLCFAGDFERADRQLDIVADQDPGAALGLALFRQLIRAAQAGAEHFSAGRLPEFLDPPAPHLQRLLEAGLALRDGQGEEAGRLAAEAEALRPPCPGRLDDAEIDDLRDIDDLVAPVFEVLTSTGKILLGADGARRRDRVPRAGAAAGPAVAARLDDRHGRPGGRCLPAGAVCRGAPRTPTTAPGWAGSRNGRAGPAPRSSASGSAAGWRARRRYRSCRPAGSKHGRPPDAGAAHGEG